MMRDIKLPFFWLLGLREGKPIFSGSKADAWDIHSSKN